MRWIALSLLGLLVTLTACGGGSDSEKSAREALPLMVLQRSEISEALKGLGSSFSTNEDAASGLGSGPTKEQLDSWGRILGYEVRYQASEPPDDAALIQAATSASLYATAEGAAESFTNRVEAARSANWAETYSNFLQLSQREITRDLPVDGSLWLRFTGFQESSPGKFKPVADDWVVFRIDRAWGFLQVTSLGPEGLEDRDLMLPTIEVMVRKQIDHMSSVLESGVLE